MANGRISRKRSVAVSGSWQPVPLPFLRSRACAELSPHAAKLFLDLLALLGPNATRNGDLSLSPQDMARRGWTSRSTLQAAVRELEAHDLIFRTKQGSRLDCNLFAVTLYPMDCDFKKLDVGPGGYTSRDWESAGLNAPTDEQPAEWRRARKTLLDAPPRDKVGKNRPATGQTPAQTKPKNGTLSRHGTKTPVFPASSVPPRVTYLDNHLSAPLPDRGAVKQKPPGGAANEPSSVVCAPAGKSRTRSAANLWTPERLSGLRAYREANGVKAAAEHFGMSRQRVVQLLPGMGKPRGRRTGRTAGNATARRLHGTTSDFQQPG